MKTLIITLACLWITVSSCDTDTHSRHIENDHLEIVTESEITFIGDSTYSSLVRPVVSIDSIQLIKKPEDYPNLEFEIKGGQLRTQVMRIGNFGFEAQIFSEGKSYLLQDTLKVRPPSANINSRFGQLLIANRENKIWVSVNGQLNEDLSLSTDEGELKELEPGEFLLSPMQEDTINISVFTTVNGTKRILGTKVFIVVNEDTKIKEIITPANKK